MTEERLKEFDLKWERYGTIDPMDLRDLITALRAERERVKELEGVLQRTIGILNEYPVASAASFYGGENLRKELEEIISRKER